MDFLYLSTVCSKKEYKRMFEKYGTTSSHASQKFNRLLLRGLVQNGIQVSTLSYRSVKKVFKDDLKHESETENGIEYNYLPHCRINKLNRFFTIIKAFVFLCKFKKKYPDVIVGVDTINAELSIAAVLYRLLSRKNTILGVVTDVPVIRANERRIGIRAIPVKIKNILIYKYDLYVFLTEYMNELLNKKRKPYVIIEGIADDDVLSEDNTLEKKHPEKVVMMAGLLEKEFGVDRLLQAFHSLDDSDARLHLYGKGKAIDLIRDYQRIDSRIKYFGEALNQIIILEEYKATILVNPRSNEGEWTKYSFPSKNIEYIASGTPLLAYNSPCIPQEYRGHFIEIANDNFETVLKDTLIKSKEDIHSIGIENRNWILTHKNPKKQTVLLAEMIKSNYKTEMTSLKRQRKLQAKRE